MADSNASASAIQPGVVLAGKFRIEQVLGQGGMGVVVAAHHLQLDERVALKFLLPEALSNAEAVARFAREARAAVKIKSEHVARVTDVGTLDNGSPYMVMEYLQGTDLGDRVAAHGALPIDEAVEYVLQACEAVAEAHAIGIVHRDLKPANLFLTRRADGSACVKVLDFGISKITTGTDSEMNMTKTATVMGSPLYMSPEQMASARDVDARADIWAIGAIIHELVTGSVPFVADTMPQLCAKILQEPAAPLRDARPDAPPGLQEVVAKCLQKKPTDRYPTVAELAADLLPYAPRRGRVSVERIAKVISAAGLTDSNLSLPHSQAPASAGGTTQGAWGTSKATTSGGARWAVVAAAVLLLAGGAAAVSLGVFGSRTSPAPAAAPPSAEPVPQPVADKSSPTATAPRIVPAAVADEASPLPSASVTEAPLAKTAVPAAPPPVKPVKVTKPSTAAVRPKPPVRPLAETQKPVQKPSATSKSSPLPVVDLYQDRK